MELEAEEDEGEQPLEDGGEPRHVPAPSLDTLGRVVTNTRAHSEEVERREGCGDVPQQRGGQTEVSQHTGQYL